MMTREEVYSILAEVVCDDPRETREGLAGQTERILLGVLCSHDFTEKQRLDTVRRLSEQLPQSGITLDFFTTSAEEAAVLVARTSTLHKEGDRRREAIMAQRRRNDLSIHKS